VFGATFVPGILITALAGVIALFVILFMGAKAMNQPGSFGQGLTAVLAALFILPAAIGASIFVGLSVGVADAFDDFESSPRGDEDFEECMSDADIPVEDCQDLRG
jgi:hypothetical protein